MPDIAAAPAAAVFAEHKDGKTYVLAMIVPPAPTAGVDLPRSPREAVFIIDTSGSMEGTSIKQAKDALQMALDRLAPGDRFNVVEFNSVTRALFGAPMPVDAMTLAKARTFVDALRARGGTEMKPALEAALTRDTAPGFVRQVVFLTDGAVGNESELVQLIRERLGDRRLFTIGIGSAPNSYFLTKAAQYGRGTFTFIGDVREVADKMGALVHQARKPGADRHRGHVAGQRRGVAARAGRPLRGRADRRRRANRRARGRRDDHRAPGRRAVECERAAVRDARPSPGSASCGPARRSRH